jgi:myo-inositol-1(or 4)-monophosphatase
LGEREAVDLTSLLNTALEAMDVASAVVTARDPGDLTPKGDRDLTSEVDFAIERSLRDFLGNRTPSIGILGEEEGMSFGSSEFVWILDPVDGTINYVRGLPLCGVSLALAHGDQPILGVIDLPFLGSRYSATIGTGAYRNGRRIYASKAHSLKEAIVAIGDYAVGENAEAKNALRLAITQGLAATALRVRMVGSAAIDLAWVADGRMDASLTMSNNPWDMAAGVVIAREAGALVVDTDGSDYTLRSGRTIAASPKLMNEFLQLVTQIMTTIQVLIPDTCQNKAQ